MPTPCPPTWKATHILMKSDGTVTWPDAWLLAGILVPGPWNVPVVSKRSGCAQGRARLHLPRGASPGRRSSAEILGNISASRRFIVRCDFSWTSFAFRRTSILIFVFAD